MAGVVIAVPDYSKWEKGFATTDLARTDSEGKFRCVVKLPTDRRLGMALAARTEGLAGDWVSLANLKDGQEVTLRLTRATVPVRGRVLTLEGKPVPGAVVLVHSVHAPDETVGLKQVYEQWPG